MSDSVQLGSLLQGVNGLSEETLLYPAGPDHVTTDVVDEHAVKYPYRTFSMLCGNRFPLARIFVRCPLHARRNRETDFKFDM
jgi:hypothetical protein